MLGLTSLQTQAAASSSAGANAIDALSTLLESQSRALGVDSPALLGILGPLAERESIGGDLDAAAALRRRALHIATKTFGSDSLQAAEAMTSLAVIHIQMQRYIDAEGLLIAARSVIISQSGDDAPALAPVLARLAQVALSRGDSGGSAGLASLAVSRYQAAPGLPDPRITIALRALGAALAARDLLTEAERPLLAAIELDRKMAGTESLALARSLTQLANLRMREKRFGDALPLLQEALSIDQLSLGPGHPTIADDLYDLGITYDSLHRAALARKAFETAIATLDRGPGAATPRYATVTLALAHILQAGGDDPEATVLNELGSQLLRRDERAEAEREKRV